MSTAAKHAYVVYGRTFITCDTPATLKMKIDAAAALGLGGLMVRGRQATCAETLQTDVHSPRTHLHKKMHTQCCMTGLANGLHAYPPLCCRFGSIAWTMHRAR